jgi:hypothetical protein
VGRRCNQPREHFLPNQVWNQSFWCHFKKYKYMGKLYSKHGSKRYKYSIQRISIQPGLHILYQGKNKKKHHMHSVATYCKER